MNDQWQQFLDVELQPGTAPGTGGDEHLQSAEQLAPGNVVAAVPDERVLRVSGEDAETFLQGQFSNDVAALNDPGSQLSTWSTPKGRVLALFRLIRTQDDYLIRLPSGLAETFLKRLRMYVLRAKVVIEEQAELVTLGVSGPDAVSLIETTLGKTPQQTDECLIVDGVVVVRVRGKADRFELTAPVQQAIELWNALTGRAHSVGEDVWRLQNIDAGVPWVGSATSEAFVLQMLNLQHIGGVSFKKGCFPGQEVVARMQYLGKLKRRMYLLTGDATNGIPSPGDELFSAGKTSAVGKVVDARPVGDGSFRMLAVCAIEAMANTVYLEAQARQAVTPIDLPYSIDAA